MRYLVKMNLDFGRMGRIESLFSCTKEEYDSLNERYVYFGEVLGKHSDISCELSENDFEIVSTDQKFIDQFDKHIGNVGLNPLKH